MLKLFKSSPSFIMDSFKLGKSWLRSSVWVRGPLRMMKPINFLLPSSCMVLNPQQALILSHVLNIFLKSFRWVFTLMNEK